MLQPYYKSWQCHSWSENTQNLFCLTINHVFTGGLKNASLNFYPIHLEYFSILHSHLRLGHANVSFVFGKNIFIN